MNKNIHHIKGSLVSPLLIGAKAIIDYNNQRIRTSTVMSISEVSANRITFETRNTIYSVAPECFDETASYMPSYATGA